MTEPGADRQAGRETWQAAPPAPTPAGWVPNPKGRVSTAIRHLALGFALLVTILFTAALCSLPR